MKTTWCDVQVVRIARQVLALPLVNIGGIDIVNGQHKLLLAILWQLMRYNIRGLLQVGAATLPFPAIRCSHEYTHVGTWQGFCCWSTSHLGKAVLD